MTTATAITRASEHHQQTVTPSRAVLTLGYAIAVLAGIASAVGLFAHGGPGSTVVTSLRGQPADLYGLGLYQFDSVLIGVGNRGTDAVTLFLEVPALVIALRLYGRRSLRGTIALVGILGWFLYYYASMTLGTAYNQLFPLYLVLFAATGTATPLALGSIDTQRFSERFPDRPSRRVLIGYLGALAAALTLAWAPGVIASALTGALPSRLGVYTTEVTWALDLGVIVPAVATSAVLLHRRNVLGPLAVTAMLSLNVALGAALLGQGVAQILADVPMTAAEKVGGMASFTTMTIVAALFLRRLLHHLPPPSA